MYSYIDKTILFTLSSILFLSTNTTIYSIVFLLMALICTCLNGYFEHKQLRYIILVGYIIYACFFVQACYFIPCMIYDDLNDNEKYTNALYLIPILIHASQNRLSDLLFLFVFCLLSWYLRQKSITLHKMRNTNKKIKDDSEELRLLHEQKQRELLDKQDYEIQLAKAEERNRIAREIHDSVGHNLSSSLLQIGAMIAINNDVTLIQPLQDMRSTLARGMDSIRNSVHDLHQDTFHLEEEMRQLLTSFQFCKTTLQYNSHSFIDMKLKYCFINILKEALNNISKHSNATHVNIYFIENPSFYQFSIHDNGTFIQLKNGLGLNSMHERVQAYNGIFSITQEHGFRIFINIPKENII